MKRLIMLAVLCAFVLSAAAASAADIKASGAYGVEALWRSNWDFTDSRNDTAIDAQQFGVYQRADTIFQFVANENLKAVLFLRYGTAKWGSDVMQIGNDQNRTVVGTTTPSDIDVRRAYLDFMYPGTSVNVKAGYQTVTLPNAFGGSALLSEEAGSLIVSAPLTDNVSVLGVYARAIDNGVVGQNADNYVDVYALGLPLSFDGFAVKPFMAYTAFGEQTAKDTSASSYGVAFEMDMFDPFVLLADLNYSSLDGTTKALDVTGWFFDAALQYKGLDFMTPEAFFVYGTGEDNDATDGSERMYQIAGSADWAIGSFFFGGDTLYAGSIDSVGDTGFWALGLSLKDIQSFADGLSHTAHLIYAKGTNDKDWVKANRAQYGNALSEKDSLIEIDFNTAYQLYDELTLTLDLGYVNYDADEESWGRDYGGDAYKVSTGLIYQF